MNKKVFKMVLIVIGGLFIILNLIGPILSLLEINEIICISGEFPKIEVNRCKNQMSNEFENTPFVIPTITANPIPVIIDDDGSPDGMIALIYFLQNPNFDVKAVTISEGEAHPQIFAQHVADMLANLGREDIPVGYGRETPLEGMNAFPDPWRAGSDNFYGIQLSQTATATIPQPATDVIIDVITNSPEPVMFFMSGPQTNLAEVLRKKPEVKDNILSVYIMGGSVYVPGNINQDWSEINNTVAEWNIWVDPVAAHEVFSSGIDVHLVPLDATNQVVWNKNEVKRLKSAGTPETTMAGNFLDVMLSMSSGRSIYIWDLVAAVVATNPNLCHEEKLALDVNVEAGPKQGQIVLDEKDANVGVCLEPDGPQIKNQVESVLLN